MSAYDILIKPLVRGMELDRASRISLRYFRLIGRLPLGRTISRWVYRNRPTKLQRELGWEPSLQFEEGIEKTVRWYLENQDWLDNVTSGDYMNYYDSMYGHRG